MSVLHRLAGACLKSRGIYLFIGFYLLSLPASKPEGGKTDTGMNYVKWGGKDYIPFKKQKPAVNVLITGITEIE